MAFRTPLWTQGASHDADVLRQLTAAVLTDGVPLASDLLVLPRQIGANMSVDVTPGRCVVGDYVCWSDATVNLTVGAPPASGQSRIDSVRAVVTDNNSGSGSWAVIVVAGTSSTSPSPPALTGTAIELARITTSSSTINISAGNITDRRQSATRPNYRTSLPTVGVDGQIVALPGGVLAVRSGSQWITHDPSWPKIYNRQIASQGYTVGTFGSLQEVPLPANVPLKVVATMTGTVSKDSTSGPDVDLTTLLRVYGPGLTVVETPLVRTRAPFGFGTFGPTFGATLAATIPASSAPVLAARYDAKESSGRVTGFSMSVTVHPG